MVRKRCCGTCVYSGRVRDGKKTRYVCSNVPDRPGRMVLRPRDGLCPRFRPRPVRTGKSEPKPSDDPWVRYIPLTQGKYAKVDASDYGWLSLHKWCAVRNGHTYYAERRHKGKSIPMHVEIMLPAEGYVVDHINGHGWDNRRGNMRNCTRAQNIRNRAKWQRACTSPYKGVSRNKRSGKYRAYVNYQGRRIHLGSFAREIDAARAYDRAARQYHGRFARLDFPEEWVTGDGKPVSPEAKTDDGGREADDGGQSTEDGRWIADNGGQPVGCVSRTIFIWRGPPASSGQKHGAYTNCFGIGPDEYEGA